MFLFLWIRGNSHRRCRFLETNDPSFFATTGGISVKSSSPEGVVFLSHYVTTKCYASVSTTTMKFSISMNMNGSRNQINVFYFHSFSSKVPRIGRIVTAALIRCSQRRRSVPSGLLAAFLPGMPELRPVRCDFFLSFRLRFAFFSFFSACLLSLFVMI